jgi:uncharacterized SAM-binding protein YcdF (DUF218 family)
MLQATTDLIKLFLVPGSLWFLICGLTAGVLLARGPTPLRRLAWPFLAALALLYWLESLPVVSEALATGFGRLNARQVTAREVSAAQAIVVLGAGVSSYTAARHTITVPEQQTVLNALEAARIFRLLEERVHVVASGGIPDPQSTAKPEAAVLLELLERDGVPADHVVLESASRTTYEQALRVAPLLKDRGWNRFVLVTSPAHLLRATAAFAAQGVQPIPGPASFRSQSPDVPRFWWRPSGAALAVSELSLYDYMAWVYYWTRGYVAA